MECVEVLLKAGADLEAGCSTPIMEAAQEGHLELVEYLVKEGRVSKIRNTDVILKFHIFRVLQLLLYFTPVVILVYYCYYEWWTGNGRVSVVSA